jgi:nucleoid DNA-binding protein
MDRDELVRRISSRGGIDFEEADRLLEVVLRELGATAARRQRMDLGDLGALVPESGATGARLVPPRNLSAFGAHRRE